MTPQQLATIIMIGLLAWFIFDVVWKILILRKLIKKEVKDEPFIPPRI